MLEQSKIETERMLAELKTDTEHKLAELKAETARIITEMGKLDQTASLTQLSANNEKLKDRVTDLEKEIKQKLEDLEKQRPMVAVSTSQA